MNRQFYINIWLKIFFPFLKLFLAFYCCSTCITPYSPPATYSAPLLVVNGQITNQPGPYTVSLSFTNINSLNSAFKSYPDNAAVIIHDDAGNQEQLTYLGKGIFQTSPSGIQGNAGRRYSVRIILSDGRVYESDPELLKKSPAIGQVSFTYFDTPEKSQRGYFKTYVQTQDSVTTGDYYRWTWKNFKYETFYYLCCISLCGAPPDGCRVSAYCEPCWSIRQCESCISLYADLQQNSGSISQLLTNVPYDNTISYYLLINQYLISEKAFQFWQNLNNQVNVTGGVFDSPPAGVPSNLHNVNDATEQVLGYFEVAGLSQKVSYIRRDNLDIVPYSRHVKMYPSISCVECKESYSLTRVKPPLWDDALDHD